MEIFVPGGGEKLKSKRKKIFGEGYYLEGNTCLVNGG